MTVNNAPPPDTTPPTVSLSAPANGATVSGTVAVSANASDNVGVAGVQFQLDGANLGAEDTVAPYSVSWNTAGAGNGSHDSDRDRARRRGQPHYLGSHYGYGEQRAAARHHAADGEHHRARERRDRFRHGDGDSQMPPDNVGVVGVQFQLDGTTNLGAEDTSAPYSVSWNTAGVANGTHTLTATARDAAGNFTTSAARTVTVNNARRPRSASRRPTRRLHTRVAGLGFARRPERRHRGGQQQRRRAGDVSPSPGLRSAGSAAVRSRNRHRSAYSWTAASCPRSIPTRRPWKYRSRCSPRPVWQTPAIRS